MVTILWPFASDCFHDRLLVLDDPSQSFETLVVQRQISELIRYLTNKRVVCLHFDSQRYVEQYLRKVVNGPRTTHISAECVELRPCITIQTPGQQQSAERGATQA